MGAESTDLAPAAGACKSCRRPILWTRTKSGANFPIDPDPAADGNVQLDGITAVVLPKDVLDKLRERIPDVKLYKSHFATCPDAPSHRKRTPKL